MLQCCKKHQGGREAYIWPKIHRKNFANLVFMRLFHWLVAQESLFSLYPSFIVTKKWAFHVAVAITCSKDMNTEYHKKFIHLSANLQRLIVIATRRAHTILTQQNRSSQFKSQEHFFSSLWSVNLVSTVSTEVSSNEFLNSCFSLGEIFYSNIFIFA